MNKLIRQAPQPSLEPASVARARKRASHLMSRSKAANTVRAYQSDWRDFTDWCRHAGKQALPATPDTVALYVATLAEGLKVSTIRRRLAAISKAHQYDGHPSPTTHGIVADVMDGIKREIGYLQKGKAPLLTDDVKAMLDAQSDTISGLRNRALLLIGFAGCLRRSEIVGLDVEDCVFVKEGVLLMLRRSKTDQYGEGIQKAIPYAASPFYCPARTLRAWLDALGDSTGPVFRRISKAQRILETRLTPQTVALLVKQAALASGLDPKRYSGHSLRAGFATQAAIRGADERAIMEQGGWKSALMARRYIRDANQFRNNAAGKLGL